MYISWRGNFYYNEKHLTLHNWVTIFQYIYAHFGDIINNKQKSIIILLLILVILTAQKLVKSAYVHLKYFNTTYNCICYKIEQSISRKGLYFLSKITKNLFHWKNERNSTWLSAEELTRNISNNHKIKAKESKSSFECLSKVKEPLCYNQQRNTHAHSRSNSWQTSSK